LGTFFDQKIGKCFWKSVFFPSVNLTNFVSSFILFFLEKKNSPNFRYYKIKKIKNLAYISATWEEILTWWVCEFLDFWILKNDLIIISSFEFGDKM
jgi:hypothetical protein